MKYFLALFILLGSTPLAFADEFESMGKFRFLDLFLSPRLRLQEPGLGGFELEQSWIGFEWRRDDRLKAIFKVGTPDLIKPAIWYSPPTGSQVAVSEAWLEGRSAYGDMRAGLIAIPQGFEGSFPEWNSVLPPSRTRQKGWVIQRDYGIQLRWETRPWSTSITAHNGESGENKDRWTWASGQWQYKNSEGFGLLLSSSFGHTRPDSTSSSPAMTGSGFAFERDHDAKIRYGIISIFREDRRSLFVLEAARGDLVQNDFPGLEKRPFGWGRADICWNFSGDASLLIRFEGLQPDLKSADKDSSSIGLGLVLASVDNLQSLTLYGSRNRENPEATNDDFWLIFRLRSNLLK